MLVADCGFFAHEYMQVNNNACLQYYTPITPLLYSYFIPILFLFYSYFTPILLLFYPYSTSILRLFSSDSDQFCFAASCATDGNLRRCNKVLDLLQQLKTHLHQTQVRQQNKIICRSDNAGKSPTDNIIYLGVILFTCIIILTKLLPEIYLQYFFIFSQIKFRFYPLFQPYNPPMGTHFVLSISSGGALVSPTGVHGPQHAEGGRVRR